jgi:hypothetical protein
VEPPEIVVAVAAVSATRSLYRRSESNALVIAQRILGKM